MNAAEEEKKEFDVNSKNDNKAEKARKKQNARIEEESKEQQQLNSSDSSINGKTPKVSGRKNDHSIDLPNNK